ncbi:Ti-type conjugative transfer relaxase TraA [Sphingopyxis terrae]|uniref:Plasmid mobilization system relaxase n=1 Tax=Sphingopyxis terrae subsp. ummariensis TaxID=429001 RepID=A0A1Y6FUV0_9SPHN|nr:Ti-type conjugative transfer relaxase TraA [Sphingopyxis terrae]PCF91055.1 Ti-type conjugative transfer relaxase TraA [Sphingopyxis terrae subsp. ummariensis]SMQ76313.1 plasmid mobilization system relaxase [Sphingopyxis terrae subsp. ummariensis]
MAIYHFSAKVISRAVGSSAVAAAAYRSASRLHDERLGRHHDFSNKTGVVHSEVMLPQNASGGWQDREQLWNRIEAIEVRKDAQLAREIEFAIPREMTEEQGIALARDFVAREFVDRGMVADLNVHWDVGADGLAKPHAHVMLTMREIRIGEDGSAEFGAKVRDWNRTELLTHWREAWAAHVNERLAALDIDARVDHRTLEAQGVDLEPQHKIGPAASRMAAQGLDCDRAGEHREIARSNGAKLLASPAIALDAITHHQATFTTRDLAMFVHRHSDGKEQFDAVMPAVKASPELVALGKDGRGEDRFTARAMIETEERLERATVRLDARRNHGVADRHRELALDCARQRGLDLSVEQRGALEHVTGARGIGNVIGYAGTGKSAMLGVARDAWEAAGYRVQGAALSGIAADGLEQGSGIASRTLASLEHQWANDRERLTDRHILVIDEAGMIGTRQLERIVGEAEKRGAKVVLVGDPEQLQAIEAGAAFRATAERHGAVEITDIRRQHEEWQRLATRWLATGRTDEALAAYEQTDHVHAAATREDARDALIDRWDRERMARPGDSRIILTHTNDEVQALNMAARARMRDAGALGDDVALKVERGDRMFATGDRIMFLRNERGLRVKNGSLGTVRQVDALRMSVLLDDGRNVAFDLKDYAHVDHGYAATIHKAQGMTVDRAHVLATPGLDRHATYVALSRHRDRVDLHYGRDDFVDRSKVVRALSRERGKDMASDYRGRTAPQPERRDMFAGLKLHPPAEPVKAPPPPPKAEPRLDPASPVLGAAVTRHAGIVRELLFTQSVGEPVTPAQKALLAESRRVLDTLQPQGAVHLERAFAVDRSQISEAVNGRTQAAIRAMQLEADMAKDPTLRADVFVQRWQALDRQRRRLLGAYEENRAYKVADRMIGMAKSLERDPQVESILRNRKQQLGLPPVEARSVGQALAEMMGRGRNRGLGIGT